MHDVGDWYSYFVAPSPYPLEEVLKSRNVVFAVTQAVVYKRYNRREIAKRHRLAQLVPPRADLLAFLEERAKKVFSSVPDGRLVGAYFRGTDYRKSTNWCPVGHAAVPRLDEWCDIVEKDMAKWGGNHGEGRGLFVVTEEQEALDAIRLRFPKALYIEKERFSDFKLNQRTVPCFLNLSLLTEIV